MLLLYCFQAAFIDKTKLFHSIFIAFVSSPLKLFKCRIMSFALLFSPIFVNLLSKRLVPLNTNAFITAPPIVNNTVLLFYYHPEVPFGAQVSVSKKFYDLS